MGRNWPVITLRAHYRAEMFTSACSIELDIIFVIQPQCGILLFLEQITIANNRSLDLGPHEAPECILGRAHDGLTAHVEAGVEQYRLRSSDTSRKRGSSINSRSLHHGASRPHPGSAPIAGRPKIFTP